MIGLVIGSPVKVSKPQAVIASDINDENPPTLSASLSPPLSDSNIKFLSPAMPFYLPDPERNKGINNKDSDFIIAISSDEMKADKPDTLVLDPYSPPLQTAVDSFKQHVQYDNRDKNSYSYNDRYDYYFPMRVVYDKNANYENDELKLMEMMPPSSENQPNYYAVKPKKIPKKFQSNKKNINQSKSSNGQPQLIPIDNDGLTLPEEKRKTFVTAHPVENFAPAPTFRDLTDRDLNIGEYMPSIELLAPRTEPLTLEGTVPTLKIENTATADRRHSFDAGDLDTNKRPLHDDERVEFQMHGYNGPNSYKFGFDTGKG